MTFKNVGSRTSNRLFVLGALFLLMGVLPLHAQTPSNTSEKAPPTKEADQSKTNNETTLKVATYGGAYGEALRLAVLEPYKSQNKITVEAFHHSQRDLALSSLTGHGTKLDVIELDQQSIDAACETGLLIKPAISTPEVSGTAPPTPTENPSEKKGEPNSANHPCGVASLTWSAVTIFNTRRFSERKPSSLRDILRTKRFPGKRAFVSNPEFMFETLLIADGVKPSKVYETLETKKGVSRVLRILSRMAKHIIWVESPRDSLRLVRDGKAVFGQSFNGRVFLETARGAPLQILWDGQIYDTNYFAIPREAKDPVRSKQFVAFATQTERLAAQASHIAYGPEDPFAVSLVDMHPTLKMDLKPFLPTLPKNRKRAVRRNADWWDINRERLQAELNNWRENLGKKKKKRRKRRKR